MNKKFNINLKKILLYFYTVVLTVALSNNIVFDRINSADDFQYWTLGVNISTSGSYGISSPQNFTGNDRTNPLLNSGQRRGEVLYPLLISTVVKFSLDEKDLDLLHEECFQEFLIKNCPLLTKAVFNLNLIVRIFFIISLFIYISNSKLKFLQDFIILSSLLFALPTYNKDAITYIMLFNFCYFAFKKNKFIPILILSLLPLINAVFYYFAIFYAVNKVFIVSKNSNFKIQNLLVVIVLIPSLLWSFRNYQANDEFSISSRGPQLLTIKAEFMYEPSKNLSHAYFWYLPSNDVTSKFKLYLLENSNLSKTRYLFDRGDSKCIVCRRYEKNGYVFAELQKIYGEQYRNLDEILDSENNSKVNSDLLKISLKTFQDDPIKFMYVSSIFFYRGLFPEFMTLAIDNATKLNTVFNIFGSLIRLLLFPYIILLLLVSLFKKNYYIFQSQAVLIFIYLFTFYSAFTHFIPRYSSVLLPAAVFAYLDIKSKNNSKL